MHYTPRIMFAHTRLTIMSGPLMPCLETIRLPMMWAYIKLCYSVTSKVQQIFIFPPLFNPPVWWWSIAIVDGAIYWCLFSPALSKPVIPKPRAAARYRAVRTSLPCREATVLHGSKYKVKIDFWCCRATICGPKMSGLSYFAIQIQSWFFTTQSKSNHSPKIFQVTMKSETLEKCSLFTTKMPHFFSINSVQILSGS